MRLSLFIIFNKIFKVISKFVRFVDVIEFMENEMVYEQ